MTGVDIKALRERMHLTQEALARILHISFVTVNRWERGHVRATNGVDAFLQALDRASKQDVDLVRKFPDWLDRGEFYFWARIFKLAYEHLEMRSG